MPSWISALFRPVATSTSQRLPIKSVTDAVRARGINPSKQDRIASLQAAIAAKKAITKGAPKPVQPAPVASPIGSARLVVRTILPMKLDGAVQKEMIALRKKYPKSIIEAKEGQESPDALRTIDLSLKERSGAEHSIGSVRFLKPTPNDNTYNIVQRPVLVRKNQGDGRFLIDVPWSPLSGRLQSTTTLNEGRKRENATLGG